MLAVFSKGRVLREHNLGTVGDITLGATVTTGGTAATKGTAVELIASTSFDVYMVRLQVSNYGLSATISDAMLDIMVGGATEEVIIPNILVGGSRGGNIAAPIPSGLGRSYSFPVYIPAGTRISAKAAGARTSTAMNVGIMLEGGHGIPPYPVASVVTSYPAAPSVPRGQAITPGTSAAEGAWTEVVASTTSAHFAVMPSFQSEQDTTMTEKQYALDIGLGAATEEMMAEGYQFGSGTGELFDGPWPDFPAYFDIPSGSRLTARVSCSGALDTNYGVMLHCLS